MPETTVILPHRWREIIKNTRGEKREVFVGGEEVKDALRWLQESRATHARVLRGAKVDDLLEIDFELTHAGQQLPGGKVTHHHLIIGRGGHLPGFENALLGMCAGEEKVFILRIPEAYRAKEIAGKDISVHVKALSVEERHVPDLDDGFAKNVGKFQGLQDLEDSIRRGLTLERAKKEKERFRLSLLERIDAETKIEVSEALVHQELETMRQELKVSVERMGLSWQDYLQQLKKDEVDLLKDLKPQAERRVRFALILRALAQEEHIEPSAKEVEEEMNRFLLQWSSPKEAEENIDALSLANYTKGILRNEKVFQYLEKIVG